MLRFLRLLFALMLSQVLIFVLVLVGFGLAVSTWQAGPIIESHSVLDLDLSGEIIEYSTLPDLPFVHERPVTQSGLLTALDAAAEDDRIDAILVELDQPDLGWGKAAELHDALFDLRRAGKPVWAYADVLDEISLYIASACDSIYMPPTGKLFLDGIGFGALFFRGAFDKFGVEPNFSRIGEYKSAPEIWERSGFSRQAREQEDWLLEDIWSEFIDKLARRRQLGHDVLEEALDDAVLQPDAAVERGFIDGVRHRAELMDRLVGDEADAPRVVSLHRYLRVHKRHARSRGPGIAVVHTHGLILRGRNGYHPSLGTILGATSVVEDLEDAATDDDIAAIVLRIDSGGGEIIASDIISDAVQRAREAKPVVVSMVDVAASGGYMMAYRADRIVAEPTTITGSIGSFIGKFNLRGLYNKVGLTQDFVTRGTHPYLWSDYHNWTAAEESLMARLQREDYARWMAGIAANRGFSPEDATRVGGGRVWTGRQALDNRLVDALGGLDRALDTARDLASLDPEEPVHLVHYPEERTFLEWVFEDTELVAQSLLRAALRRAALPDARGWAVLDLRRLR